MKKILVPLDFSNDSLNALEHALLFSEKCGSDVRMIHVKANKNFDVPFQIKDVELPAGDMINDFFKVVFERYRTKFSGKEHLDSVVRQGKVFDEISKEAMTFGADLIIMGTHGVSGFEEFWIGSNAYRTVCHAPCPVMTIRGNVKAKLIEKILFPIDITSDTLYKTAYVTNLALKFDAEVHIISLLPTSEDTEIMEEFEKKLNYVKEEFVKSGITRYYYEDDTDDKSLKVIELAKKIRADIITIMSDRQKKLLDYIVSNEAQEIVNHSSIPVLSIHHA